MSRPKKPKTIRRPPVPAPEMLKLVEGPPVRPELSGEDFRDAIIDLRAAYQYRIQNLMMSTSGSTTAIMVVALCNQVLMSPPDDTASSFAVRAAFRLGGLFAQEWSIKTWNTEDFGQALASVAARKDGATEGNLKGKKSLAANLSHQAVKQMFDDDPAINGPRAQQQLKLQGLRRPNDKTLQGWLRRMREERLTH